MRRRAAGPVGERPRYEASPELAAIDEARPGELDDTCLGETGS